MNKIILIFHKSLSKLDGQTAYLLNLIRILSSQYEVIIPSEKFFESYQQRKNKVQNASWFRTFLKVNAFLLIWSFRNKRELKSEVIFVIGEDRYTVFSALFISKVIKCKFVARVSDWGVPFSSSMPLYNKLHKALYSFYSKIYELAVIRKSDTIIVPSEYVKKEVKLNARCNVLVLPFSPPSLTRVTRDTIQSEKVSCLFLGNYEYLPNKIAINYIISELAPKLKLLNSSINIIIAGDNTNKIIRPQLENVIIKGKVDNLEVLFRSSYIGINPTKTVGGASIKNIEYLLAGMIVVSTPEAAIGVISTPRIIISDLDKFAETIAELSNKIKEDMFLSDSPEMSRISRYYSFERNSKLLLDFFGREVMMHKKKFLW